MEFKSSIQELKSLVQATPIPPLASVETLQSYLDSESQVNQKLEDLLKKGNPALTRIEHASEHAELQEEKATLDAQISNLDVQQTLADISLAKYKAALSEMIDLRSSEAQDKHIKPQVLEKKTQEISNEINSLDAEIEALRSEVGDLQDQLGKMGQKDNSEENSHSAQAALELRAQQTRLLVAAGVVAQEQNELQEFYDVLHQIDDTINDVENQYNYRKDRYTRLRDRQSLWMTERSTIDARDEQILHLAEKFGINSNLIADFKQTQENTTALEEIISKFKSRQALLMQVAQPSGQEEFQENLERLQKLHDNFAKEVSTAYDDVVISESGLSERNFMVEFWLNQENPRFLTDLSK